jgi:glutaredoxin
VRPEAANVPSGTADMKFFLLAACGCLASLAAQAEIYKWADKDGVVHYADTKPRDETVEVREFAVSPIRIDDRGVVAQVNPPRAERKPVPEPKPEITLGGLLAYAREYLNGLWGDKKSPAAPQTVTSPADTTVVISNDNMGVILEQIERDKQAQQEKEAARTKQTVEIFTAPWCGYCKKAIVYLELNKIPYEEYDVTINASAALRQKMLGGSGGVPFAVINGETIPGWNQQAYARALGLAK